MTEDALLVGAVVEAEAGCLISVGGKVMLVLSVDSSPAEFSVLMERGGGGGGRTEGVDTEAFLPPTEEAAATVTVETKGVTFVVSMVTVVAIEVVTGIVGVVVVIVDVVVELVVVMVGLAVDVVAVVEVVEEVVKVEIELGSSTVFTICSSSELVLSLIVLTRLERRVGTVEGVVTIGVGRLRLREAADNVVELLDAEIFESVGVDGTLSVSVFVSILIFLESISIQVSSFDSFGSINSCSCLISAVICSLGVLESTGLS